MAVAQDLRVRTVDELINWSYNADEEKILGLLRKAEKNPLDVSLRVRIFNDISKAVKKGNVRKYVHNDILRECRRGLSATAGEKINHAAIDATCTLARYGKSKDAVHTLVEGFNRFVVRHRDSMNGYVHEIHAGQVCSIFNGMTSIVNKDPELIARTDVGVMLKGFKVDAEAGSIFTRQTRKYLQQDQKKLAQAIENHKSGRKPSFLARLFR